MSEGDYVPPAPPPVPARNLPARLMPTKLSTEAANLIHSLVHDATRFGYAKSLTELSEDYMHMGVSRQKLIAYIARLERKLAIEQHQFFKFD